MNQVQNSWLVKDRVILQKLSGVFKGDVSKEAAQNNYEMLENGRKPVHIVVDMRETRLTGELSIKDGISLTLEYLEHDNMGYIVVAGMQNPLIKMFVSIISGVTKYEVFVEPDVNSALRKIKHLDNTIE